MSYQFRDPTPPPKFSIGDYVGEVVLVVIGGLHEAWETLDYGVKPALRCAIVVLTGDSSGSVFDDVLLFGRRALCFPGMGSSDVSVARVVKEGRAIDLIKASDYDKKMAAAWCEANSSQLAALVSETVRSFRENSAGQKSTGDGSRKPAPSPQFTPPAKEEERMPGEVPLPIDEEEPGY